MTEQKNKNAIKKIFRKRQTLKYGVLALVVIIAAIAVVQMVPGDSEESSAAVMTPSLNCTVDLSNLGTLPTGITWNGTTTVTFGSPAANSTYEIKQTSNAAALTMNVVFPTGVSTDVILNGINITGNITLQGNASVSLWLAGTNNITGSVFAPYTNATTIASVTIDSASESGSDDGSLTIVNPNVTSSGYGGGAGIGGDAWQTGGNVTINGGTVDVSVTNGSGAGIGGGTNTTGDTGSGGTITINGGVVTAHGGNGIVNPSTMGVGAGIGAGGGGAGAGKNGQSGGIITITGGTVTATGGSGPNNNQSSFAAGIGGSGDQSGSGTITITGGKVTAIGGKSTNDTYGGAGIGTGSFPGSATGQITIKGNSTVIATGGNSSAGIGGGTGSDGGTITIGDTANVTATGGGGGTYGDASGIGAGNYTSPGIGATLSIASTATVTAYSKGGLPAIYAASIDTANGYFVNAVFISGTALPSAPFNMYVVGSQNTILKTLTAPGGYRGFAFMLPDSASPENYGVYLDMGSGSIKPVLRNYDGGTDIMSVNSLSGYNSYGGTNAGNSAGSLPVKLGDSYTMSLIYDVNGGDAGSGPAQVDDLVPNTIYAVDTSTIPTYTVAVGGTPIVFIGWTLDDSVVGNILASGKPAPVLETNVTAGVADVTLYAVWEYQAVQPPQKNYDITASADSGSMIDPSGVVSVQSGGSQTFTFQANAGYHLVSVTVDGVSVPQALTDGSYTFTNVTADHTIQVTSVSEPGPAAMTLTIDVGSGGHAEYSLDGGQTFTEYTKPVTLLPGSDVAVRAVADDGYSFEKWVDGSTVTDKADLHLGVIGSSVYLNLYFSSNGGNGHSNVLLWILAAIILLILIGLLLWFLLFYRRYYDVVKPSGVNVIGDDKVHRKSAYTFTLEGIPSGVISYRVGNDENAQWKVLPPSADGKYVIPKGEITDNVTIDYR